MDDELTVRRARHDDYEAVAAFTRETWADRDGTEDYIPRIYHDWIDGETPEASRAAGADGSGDSEASEDASSNRSTECSGDSAERSSASSQNPRGSDDSEGRSPSGSRAQPDDGDSEKQRTLVAEADDGADVAGICQGVLLSDHEAWIQGMRVNPDYRGRGVASGLTRALFEWAAEAGAKVARNMVFSWNVAGLGLSRAAGFDPCTEFRWAHPDPDPDADPDLDVVADADAAWAFWGASAARDRLRGLALDAGESWAVSELTRDRLRAAAADGRLAVVRGDGTRGFALRSRIDERESESESGGVEAETLAEYAVGAWADRDAEAARALLRAVARDAAAVDADRTRVLIPEGVGPVSDVAAARVDVSEEPDFVLAADLTDRAVRGDGA